MKAASKVKTATEVRRWKHPNGEGRLYRMDPRFKGRRYVIVSTANIARMLGGMADMLPPGFDCETYIFPATAAGDFVDMVELEGSFKGGMDHAEALSNIGYVVATGSAPVQVGHKPKRMLKPHARLLDLDDDEV